MKKISTLFISMVLFLQFSKAQNYAMDFTMNDCNGVSHNCFATLDSAKVIIMEFFMDCSPCVVAGHEIEAMQSDLAVLYPDLIEFYQMAYINDFGCTNVLDWYNLNGFSSFPFDSGEALVNYYGGFGMPSIVVVGGKTHDVLYNQLGYTPGDSADIANAITDYFIANYTSVNEIPADVNGVNVYPNPADNHFNIQLNLNKPGTVSMQLLTLSGKTVAPLINEKMKAGPVLKTFSTETFAPGLYLLVTTVNGNSSYRKVDISH